MLAKKKVKEEEEYTQLTLDDLSAPKLKIHKTSEVEEDGKEVTVFENEKKQMIEPEIPDDVKKNNTRLLNEVININIGEIIDESLSLEVEESAVLSIPIQNKVSLSYNKDMVEQLTNFDKEVMDAVATLAPHTKIITATTIFRIISGKLTGAVNIEQRKKVNESMNRCRQYIIEIDLTSEYLKEMPHEIGNTTSLKYNGSLISFTGLDKKARNGSNYYYKILDIPPLFKMAEAIGKVSMFPIALLDTPIQKTEQVIVIQGYLLREIDNMIKKVTEENFIEWDSIYQIAEIDMTVRQYKSRIRGYVATILDFWKEKKFIVEYTTSLKKNENGIKIYVESK